MGAGACAIMETATLSDGDFLRMSGLIENELGIKMPPAKKALLESRLQKRLRHLGLRSFSDYCSYLFSPRGVEEELVHMIDLVTTNKTDFFREPHHFDYLLEEALPGLLGKGPPRAVSVWSAGCSTGEEPYTIAMSLGEFALRNPGFGFSITATDISTRVLHHASVGVYGEERVTPVPPGMRKRYLLRSKDRSKGLVKIAPELKGRVRFLRLNLMDEDFGFPAPFDLIFCRNVVIYFDKETQERLFGKLASCLRRGGFLFIGHSETLAGFDLPLEKSGPSVYRRI